MNYTDMRVEAYSLGFNAGIRRYLNSRKKDEVDSAYSRYHNFCEKYEFPCMTKTLFIVTHEFEKFVNFGKGAHS